MLIISLERESTSQCLLSGYKTRTHPARCAIQVYTHLTSSHSSESSPTAIMHIGKTLATVACLGSGALSFKVRAFSNGDCTGTSKEYNIYDNTCKGRGVSKIQSFQVLAYGARRQRAGFYSDGSCNAFRAWTDYWADGGSDKFKKGRCVKLGFGAYSLGSRSA